MVATAIGIDIGGTKIAAAVVDSHGIVGTTQVVPTGAAEGAAAVLGRVVALARSVRSSARSRPSAIGIATGGWIEPTTGRVALATGLLPDWVGLALGDLVGGELGLPAVVLNDVHAMGLAEARLGAGRGARVCLSVAVGTGIGGAITVDGRLLTGAHGIAGALGHIASPARGARCSCGRRGCIEAAASGPAIARSFRRCAPASDPPGQRTRRGPIGLPAVVDALSSGDDGARACAERVVTRAGALLGTVLGGVANTVDPDLIVIGGGAALALGQPFLVAIAQATSEVALSRDGVAVVPAGLGPDAAVVGAGLMALANG